MPIARDHLVFESVIKNYWEYYRELEEEFLLTRRYVDFDGKNKEAFSVEFLKLYQAVCSEIDVVGKAMAQIAELSFVPTDTKNNILKWWFFIQDEFKLAEGPFTLLNPSKVPAVYALQDYKCFLLGRIEIQPWKGFGTEKRPDVNGVIRFNLVPGGNTPAWWSAYNKVKHNRITLGSPDINYEKANLGNVMHAFAALYILEKALMDTVGTKDDLDTFLDFSSLFVVQRRYTGEEMNALFGLDEGC